MLRSRLFTTATSLDLSGIITDETGTGSLVFSNNPTILTPTFNGTSTFTGLVNITNATASTNTTTGALQVAGGVGVGGALNVGGNAVINGVTAGIPASGISNTVFGNAALRSTAVGNQNVAIGSSALATAGTAFTGNTNCCVGHSAGGNLTGSSSANTIIGSSSIAPLSATYSNATFVGAAAGVRNQVSNTTGVGSSALLANTLGTANVAMGSGALASATTAVATVTTTVAGTGGTDGAKTAVQLERDSGGTMVTYPTVDLTVTSGAVAGTVTVATGGTGSTTATLGGIVFKANAAGIAAGVPADWRCQLDTAATGINNTAVGHQAGLLQTTASSNTLVGANAGDAITIGTNHALLGHNAGGNLTTSIDSTAIGSQSLRDASTAASGATAVGAYSAIVATSASNATALGALALFNATTITNTVAIGNQAARYRGTGTDTCTNATNSIFIGQDTRPSGNSESNQIVIGHQGRGNGSNTTTIGNTSTTGTFIPGGNLTLSNGNLILGTSGNGISFAATSDPAQRPAAKAIGVVSRTATNVANNDTVTVGASTYTFKTTLTPANGEVLIGADAAASLTNLGNAINGTGGTPGTDYQVAGANASAEALPIESGSLRLFLRALTAGSAGNSIVLNEASAQLSRQVFAGGANATDPATSETLSDYEEGTWSPVYACSSGSFDAVYMNVTSAQYIKVGRMVTVWANIDAANVQVGSGSGNMLISGLPYLPQISALDTLGRLPGYTCRNNGWSSTRPRGVRASHGSASLEIMALVTGGTVDDTLVATTNLATGASSNQLSFSITYPVA